MKPHKILGPDFRSKFFDTQFKWKQLIVAYFRKKESRENLLGMRKIESEMGEIFTGCTLLVLSNV